MPTHFDWGRARPREPFTPCRLHLGSLGVWHTELYGEPRRGDYLHVVPNLAHAPLTTARIRIVLHVLLTRVVHVYAVPKSPEDRSALALILREHGHRPEIILHVRVVKREHVEQV